MAEGRKDRPQEVFTLIVEVGRSADDGLPQDATGARLLCYAAGVNEAEAVRETIAVLKRAGLSPLEAAGQGTLAERCAEGEEVDEEEKALMARALAENSVIVAEVTPLPVRAGAGRSVGTRASEGKGRRR